MDEDSTQSTILVKKADGTMARMTLDEIKKMRAEQVLVKPTTDLVAQRINEIPELLVTQAVLEESEADVMAEQPVLEAESEEILSHEELKNEEALEENKIDEIEEVEQKAEILNSVPSWSEDDHKSLLDPSFHTDLLPMIETTNSLATTAPVGKVFVNEAAAVKEFGISDNNARLVIKPDNIPDLPVDRQASPITKQEFIRKNVNEENVWKASDVKVKTTLRDVVPAPAMQNMSPIDELRAFTVIDFRRLGATPAQAVPAIIEKFRVLKEESYLLYLDAVEAWQGSPIYQSYLSLAAEALQTRKSLEVVLSMQADRSRALKMEEWKAVGSVNLGI